MLDELIKAIAGENNPADKIETTFTNGRKVVYTMNCYELLKNDPQVVEIVDQQTGEIIFYR